MSHEITPLNIETLKPFPLDQQLQSLPPKFRDEFASLYDLVKGYTRQLDTYRNAEQHARDTINETIDTINKICDILDSYEENSSKIARSLEQADKLYKEFLSLETLQYQLLSTNFNSALLKQRFGKMVEKSDEDSKRVVSDYRKEGGDLTAFLLQFKDSRKTYHARREKLNRWSEDRVAGFI